MGRDGLLPRVLGSVHPRYGSPWASILAVAIPVVAMVVIAGFKASAQAQLETVVGGSSIFIGATFVITGFACVRMHVRRSVREKTEKRHVLTGIVLPGLGALGTLGFLVYYVATQPTVMQILTAIGCALAVAFAATAGFWSHPPVARPIEEEA